MERMEEILDRGWLTNAGPCVHELQEKLADFLNVKHCICTANGSIALELAIRAAGLCDEVIIPSFTFIATAHSLQWQQITPVFCDVDPLTHNIDPARVEQMITPRTTGIIGVHLWGRPCQVDVLQEIADRHGLKLLFDAAHAFGCSSGGKMIGGFGEAEAFSFHATKFFNSFEGGAVATNDDRLANEVRLMKNFGFTDYDRVDYIGTNGKMSEPSAAMGLTNLEHIEEVVEHNRENHSRYQEGLADLPGLELARYDQDEDCNYQYVIVEVDKEACGFTRDELMAILHAENVLARRYFYPGCHNMQPYRSYFPNAGLVLPHTQALTQRVLCLPTGKEVGAEAIAMICDILARAIASRDMIRQADVKFGLQPLPYGETGITDISEIHVD